MPRREVNVATLFDVLFLFALFLPPAALLVSAVALAFGRERRIDPLPQRRAA